MIASSLAVLTAGHGMETQVFARSAQSAGRFEASFAAHWQLMVQNGVATQEQTDICATYAIRELKEEMAGEGIETRIIRTV